MSSGQAALIDHLSQEIGVSQSIGDVTMTVDSATVGDDGFYLLFRMEREWEEQETKTAWHERSAELV